MRKEELVGKFCEGGMYKLEPGKSFENDLKKLDRPIQRRILDKLEYLAANPHLIKRIVYTPKDLSGLCKYTIGDWRVFYWPDHKNKILKLYGIEHRSRAYKRL